MSSIVIAGDTSGTCTLQAANVAGTTVLNLPTTSGTLVATGGAPSFTTVTTGLGNAAAPSITFTGDTNTGIFSPTADTIAFTEGGTESMRIDASGRLLVGTTTASSAGSIQMVLSNSVGAGIQLNNSTGANGGAINSVGGNGLVFYGYSGAMGSESYSERMRIDSSGNVGIGTSSPTQRLTVAGFGAFSGVNRGVTLGEDNCLILGDSATLNNAQMRFYTANTERGRFDTSGNFLFNSGYGSVATAYGCRAWVTYNGSTAAVIASGGVSSVTKNGTGDWTVNFSITFPDANYAVAGFVKPTSGQANYTVSRSVQGRHDTAPTTTQCRVSTVSSSTGQEDNDNTRIMFVR